MARVTRYHGLLLPDEGQPTDYRTQAAREPEPVLEPALRRGPPAPPTWKQIGIFLLVLPLVIAFMASMLSEGQGGTLVCNRASNRCDLDNGWLIHDREQFPPDHLQGAKVVRSHSTSIYYSNHKIYGVEITTSNGVYDLGGASADHAGKIAVAATIDAFAKDPSVPSLDVHVAAGTLEYVLVSLLGLIYGAFGLALLIGWLREKRRPMAPTPVGP